MIVWSPRIQATRRYHNNGPNRKPRGPATAGFLLLLLLLFFLPPFFLQIPPSHIPSLSSALHRLWFRAPVLPLAASPTGSGYPQRPKQQTSSFDHLINMVRAGLSLVELRSSPCMPCQQMDGGRSEWNGRATRGLGGIVHQTGDRFLQH